MAIKVIRRVGLACGFFSVLVLAGCSSGGSSEEPSDRYRRQTVKWEACTEDLAKQLQALPIEMQHRSQCASIVVPLDHQQPDKGDISVGIMRIRADNAATDRRLLFLNPGGPGADGIGKGVMLAYLWSLSSEHSEIGRLQLELLKTYDLIGFSPRGLGKSTNLVCESEAVLQPTDNSIGGRTDENIALQLHNTRLIAEACSQNPLTEYINTHQTAQDMDLIREVLGAQKFNYLGWSYGTWLGAWYGSLFPDKVDRMILDSSVDFDLTLHDTALVQGPALTRAFNEILAPYAARHPDVFELGTDVQAIRVLLGNTRPVLQAAVSSLIYLPLFRSRMAEEVLGYVLVARELDKEPFRSYLPDGVVGGNVEQLRLLVDSHVFSVKAHTDRMLRKLAHNVVDKIEYLLRPRPVLLKGSDAVYTAVVCNDTPSPSDDPGWWVDVETNMYANYPMVTTDDVRSCLYWQRPDLEKPSIDAMADLDVLMLQAEYDGATPEPQARATFSKLPKAHMVYVPDEMSHGVYPYSDQCVDMAVARYLLHQPLQGRETTCKAHPLIEDDPSIDKSASAVRALAEGSNVTYPDRDLAAELIEQLKASVR